MTSKKIKIFSAILVIMNFLFILTSCQNKQNGEVLTCSFTIECTEAINTVSDNDKKQFLPEDGIIYYNPKLEFYKGQSVFDILADIAKENKIHLEYSGTKSYPYVEGISNLYEFDYGAYSGWVYTVNEETHPVSSGQTFPKNDDKIVFRYTINNNTLIS